MKKNTLVSRETGDGCGAAVVMNVPQRVVPTGETDDCHLVDGSGPRGANAQRAKDDFPLKTSKRVTNYPGMTRSWFCPIPSRVYN